MIPDNPAGKPALAVLNGRSHADDGRPRGQLSKMSGCGNIEGVILGLKRDLKTTRERVRELKDQNVRWYSVAQTLRKLAGLDEEKFKNLLKAESLPCE